MGIRTRRKLKHHLRELRAKDLSLTRRIWARARRPTPSVARPAPRKSCWRRSESRLSSRIQPSACASLSSSSRTARSLPSCRTTASSSSSRTREMSSVCRRLFVFLFIALKLAAVAGHFCEIKQQTFGLDMSLFTNLKMPAVKQCRKCSFAFFTICINGKSCGELFDYGCITSEDVHEYKKRMEAMTQGRLDATRHAWHYAAVFWSTDDKKITSTASSVMRSGEPNASTKTALLASVIVAAFVI